MEFDSYQKDIFRQIQQKKDWQVLAILEYLFSSSKHQSYWSDLKWASGITSYVN